MIDQVSLITKLLPDNNIPDINSPRTDVANRRLHVMYTKRRNN